MDLMSEERKKCESVLWERDGDRGVDAEILRCWQTMGCVPEENALFPVAPAFAKSSSLPESAGEVGVGGKV